MSQLHHSTSELEVELAQLRVLADELSRALTLFQQQLDEVGPVQAAVARVVTSPSRPTATIDSVRQ